MLASLPCLPIFVKCQVNRGLSENSVWRSGPALQVLSHLPSPEADAHSALLLLFTGGVCPEPCQTSGLSILFTLSRMNGCCLCFELPDSNPECNYFPDCCNKIPNKSKLRKVSLDSRFKETPSIWVRGRVIACFCCMCGQDAERGEFWGSAGPLFPLAHGVAMSTCRVNLSCSVKPP